MPRNKRRIFRSKEHGQVQAGGVLLYKWFPDGLKFLMIKDKDKNGKGKIQYSDIGGKVEDPDETIFDTVDREVREESNGVISSDDYKLNLWNSIAWKKYIMFFAELKKDYDVEIFGKYEKSSKWIIERTFEWVSMHDIITQQIPLSYRLKHPYLYDIFEIICTCRLAELNYYKL